MANYKLITYTAVGSSSEEIFEATATNTVVSSITAKDGSGQTAEVLIQKNGVGTVIEMAEVDLTSNAGFQIIDVAFALEAGDKVYIRSTRGGMKFIMSYVEETDVPNDTALGGLLDVDTTGASDGQSLVYDSSAGEWVPQTITGGTGGGGASALDDLSDVAITGGTSGHILRSNGTNFVNVSPTTDIIPEGSTNEYYTDAKVDARIAADTTKADASHTHVHSDITDFDTATNALIAAHPDLGDANVNADWNATSGDAEILNKPALFSGVYNDLTGKPALFDGDYGSLANVPATFAPSSHNHTASEISDFETQVDSILAGTYLYELDDVADYSGTAPTIGEVLKWNGSAWAPGTDNTSSGGSGGVVDSVNGISQATVVLDADDIDDSSTTHKFVAQADVDKLANITVASAVNLDLINLLASQNTSSISNLNSSVGALQSSVGAHNDVVLSSANPNMIADGNFLIWDAGNTHFTDRQPTLDDLDNVDVSTSAPSIGEVLEWDGSNFVPAAAGSGSSTLSGLSDVLFGQLSSGEVLKYDGSEWVNDNILQTEVSGLTTALADINTELDEVVAFESDTGIAGYIGKGAQYFKGMASGQTLTAGNMYYLSASGWALADLSTEAAATGMLAMCGSTTDGTLMLQCGIVNASNSQGGYTVGEPVYLGANGTIDNSPPTTSGHFARIVGYYVNSTHDTIFFNPSSDWIEIS